MVAKYNYSLWLKHQKEITMADLLIKGMEMPKNCFNCSTKINPDERRCNFDGHIFEETLSKITIRRDENCPLVEVPTHGCLMDADLLYNKWIWGSTDRTADTKCIELIDLSLAPTVIEASE